MERLRSQNGLRELSLAAAQAQKNFINIKIARQFRSGDGGIPEMI